jgi:hypothetical protein
VSAGFITFAFTLISIVTSLCCPSFVASLAIVAKMGLLHDNAERWNPTPPTEKLKDEFQVNQVGSRFATAGIIGEAKQQV